MTETLIKQIETTKAGVKAYKNGIRTKHKEVVSEMAHQLQQAKRKSAKEKLGFSMELSKAEQQMKVYKGKFQKAERDKQELMKEVEDLKAQLEPRNKEYIRLKNMSQADKRNLKDHYEMVEMVEQAHQKLYDFSQDYKQAFDIHKNLGPRGLLALVFNHMSDHYATMSQVTSSRVSEQSSLLSVKSEKPVAESFPDKLASENPELEIQVSDFMKQKVTDVKVIDQSLKQVIDDTITTSHVKQQQQQQVIELKKVE